MHLEHNRAMLAFLLDILEVPKLHTGVALAKAFQQILKLFGLQDQICLLSNVNLLNLPSQQIPAVNADNALLNDTQEESLADMPNPFELENHMCCFNHTLQLSMKTLFHPFNMGLGKRTEDGDGADVDDLLSKDNEDEEDEDEDEDKDEDEDLSDIPDIDDLDNGIDKLDELNANEHEDLIADMAAIYKMVSKLHCLVFTIV
jgi:hypothetical protein